MKYIKPEMDIWLFKNSEVFTDDIVHVSDVGGTGEDEGGFFDDIYGQF